MMHKPAVLSRKQLFVTNLMQQRFVQLDRTCKAVFGTYRKNQSFLQQFCLQIFQFQTLNFQIIDLIRHFIEFMLFEDRAGLETQAFKKDQKSKLYSSIAQRPWQQMCVKIHLLFIGTPLFEMPKTRQLRDKKQNSTGVAWISTQPSLETSTDLRTIWTKKNFEISDNVTSNFK